jgi:hypothetical protein
MSKLLPFEPRPDAHRPAEGDDLLLRIAVKRAEEVVASETKEVPTPKPVRAWGPDRPQPVLPGEGKESGSPLIDCTLTKGDRRRRYWIREAPGGAGWIAQVFIGDAQHRGANVSDLLAAQRLWWQSRTEILELQEDGWSIHG